MPALHPPEHIEAPVVAENLPAVQSVQLIDPVLAENLPAVQSVQLLDPVLAVYLPAPHL